MSEADVRELVNQAIDESVKVTGDGRVFRGSAVESITAVPAGKLHEAVVQRIEDVKRTQTILNAVDMTEAELDELAANLLVSRDQGSKATGSVRVYFSRPQAFSIVRGSAFLTDSGLKFFVVTPVKITEIAMQLNVDGGRYYLDVPLVEAESEGDQYEVDPGGITSFNAGGQAVVGVNNLVALAGGRAKETNAELVVRMQDAVSVRDLNIRRSIRTQVFANFPDVEHIYSSGYGDPETMHDTRFGVHSGGEVYVHLYSPRLDVFEEVLTGFTVQLSAPDVLSDGTPFTAMVGFIRPESVVEPSKRTTETVSFAGGPPAVIVLDGEAGESLDFLDLEQPFVVKQTVLEEAHTFADDGFTVNNPDRVISNVRVVSDSDGTLYFCGTDYSVDRGTGVVTRLNPAMHDDVLITYTWLAVLGVDYDLDVETGTVTALSSGWLSSGDVVVIAYSYYRVGRRDDSGFTITNTPVRRIRSVSLLDADDNVVKVLPFVPPVEPGDDDGDFHLGETGDLAPADEPWWTWRVMSFNVAAVDTSHDEYMVDSSGIYKPFFGIETVLGLLPSGLRPWPRHGCLRYTVHEELVLYFVNPGVPFDGTTRLKVEYEVPTSVRVVQNYLSDPTRRILCARLLARAFVPVFVDITLYGVVGDHDQVVEAVEKYIEGLAPGKNLSVAKVADVILDESLGGASNVNTPFTLRGTLQFPRGPVFELVSTGEINVTKMLAAEDVGLGDLEHVSNNNVKFLPGVIEVKA